MIMCALLECCEGCTHKQVNHVSWMTVITDGTLISPLPVKPGDFRFPRRLSLCLSVRLSARLSVSPLDVRPLGFPNFSQSSFEILT